MGQAGVSTARDGRRSRAWVDFGVDESWEPAPRRRRGQAAPPAEVMVEDAYEAGFVRFTGSAQPTPSPVPASFPAGYEPERAADAFPVAYEPDPADYAAVERAGYATVGDTAGDLAGYATVSDTAGEPAGIPGRRTVTIRGRGAERELAFPTYRSANRPATPRRERPGYKPDRTAMWAVLLGVLLVLVAATSSHAAVLSHHDAVALAHHHAAVLSHHAALIAPARLH